MIKSLLITVLLTMSSVFSPIGFDDSFYESNLDAQRIIEENNILSEQELYDFVLDYTISEPITFGNYWSDSSNSNINTKEYLDKEYADVLWRSSETKK